MSTLDDMMSIRSYTRKVGHDLDFESSLLSGISYCKMYVIMDLMHLVSQISIQMAYYLTLTTHIQVVCPHWMI